MIIQSYRKQWIKYILFDTLEWNNCNLNYAQGASEEQTSTAVKVIKVYMYTVAHKKCLTLQKNGKGKQKNQTAYIRNT